jgi:alpha,alpha-trehalase
MSSSEAISRRAFVAFASTGAAATMASLFVPAIAQKSSSGTPDTLKQRWRKLDDAIRGWWDGDLRKADEAAIRDDPKKTLLFLPFPYISGGGSESAFPEIYGWDTQFTNFALLQHGRRDIVRWHILDQLSQIDRFGMVLNGNRSFYTSRGQPPLLPWSVKNYLNAEWDENLAQRAYPSLVNEYVSYWNGPSHQTPIGLSTCRDLGTDTLSPPLAAECEAGLDFTPIFDGDVRRCVPIHINVALVRYARVLSFLADRLSWRDQTKKWQEEAEQRIARINEYCWDESEGCYFEYDYVRKKRLPFYSLNAFWPLWEGIASAAQARRVVGHLELFDHPYGLAFTDRSYPSPHPEYPVNEWAYPEAWPPQHIVVGQALVSNGYQDQAREVSRKYIANVVTTWEQTGHLWERYNAVEGGHDVPLERAPPRPLHGFSSAAAVVVGRIAFG